MIETADPVLGALADLGVLAPADLELLRHHGRPYQGAALPAGIELFPRGSCLDATDALEAAGHGTLVIGFALRPGDDLPLGHAWSSPNGCHAIDGAWTEPTSCSYFGIPGRRLERKVTRMWRALHRAYGWDTPEPASAWANVEIAV